MSPSRRGAGSGLDLRRRSGTGARVPRPSASSGGANPIGSLVAPTAVFIVAATYLGITAASVTHRDLLTGGQVTLPVLNVGVPLLGPFGFCWIGPLLLVVLHASLLLRQYVAAQAALETGALAGRGDPTFALAFPAVGAPRGLARRKLRYLVKFSYLAGIALLPLGVLVMFQVSFLPYHGPVITRFHQALVVVDLLLIWFLVGSMTTPSFSLRRSFWIKGPRHRWWWAVAPVRFVHLRLTKALGAAVSILILLFVFWVAVIPSTGLDGAWGLAPWPSRLRPIKRNLELRNAILVREAPDTRLVVYELEHARPRDGEAAERVLNEAWRKHSTGLRLSGRDFRNADFSGARLFRADLREADLRGASLVGAHLEGADLSSEATRLEGADLRSAFLERADFTGVRMAGVELGGASGAKVEFQDADLRNVKAQGVALEGIGARGARLDGADLSGSRLGRGSFDDASLVGAILTGADVADSTFRASDLRGALFADVDGQSIDFSLALTQGAVFLRANLRNARGLETPGVSLAQADLFGATFGWGRAPIPYLTDLRGVERFEERPPSGSQLLLYDPGDLPDGPTELVASASPAAFFSELAIDLVNSACNEAEKPQLMNALVRRSVGCFGPREPQLERALRANILERARGERRRADAASGGLPPAARPRPGRCPALAGAPKILVQGLRTVEALRHAREPVLSAQRAPYFACGPAPLLPPALRTALGDPGMGSVARRLRRWDEGLTRGYSQP